MTEDLKAAWKRLAELATAHWDANCSVDYRNYPAMRAHIRLILDALRVQADRAKKAEAELAGRPYAESLATAVKRIEELEDAGIAERERAEKLEKALRSLLLSADASWEEANAGHDWPQYAQAAREALRPAAPEAKESDCTCGEQWPCPLHGGPPAAPEPTPSGRDMGHKACHESLLAQVERRAKKAEAELAAERKISTLLERERDNARGRAADAETRLVAANERAEGYRKLLRDIADDATGDWSISPGLNSVQAVLEALRPAAGSEQPR